MSIIYSKLLLAISLQSSLYAEIIRKINAPQCTDLHLCDGYFEPDIPVPFDTIRPFLDIVLENIIGSGKLLELMLSLGECRSEAVSER